ncbi:hypothetical protein QTG56_19550 [Rossellomorea sp. AcN35-11]|nr:hypothetical protein QTG56_19550 [Rossellomorea sp. AcN35-11]
MSVRAHRGTPGMLTTKPPGSEHPAAEISFYSPHENGNNVPE